jgi:hypothetical protein
MKRSVAVAIVWVFVFVVPAFATGNDPCKVLTAEKFSQIMASLHRLGRPVRESCCTRC